MTDVAESGVGKATSRPHLAEAPRLAGVYILVRCVTLVTAVHGVSVTVSDGIRPAIRTAEEKLPVQGQVPVVLQTYTGSCIRTPQQS